MSQRDQCVRAACQATLALVLLAAFACDRFDDTPREVAAQFWSALEARDFAAAGRLSNATGEAALRKLSDELPLRNVTLTQILRNESTALVETSGRLADHSLELTFNTHLSQRTGGWWVDVHATHRELRRTALAAAFEDIQEALSQSADRLVEEFEQQALEASEALREALEELKRSLGDEPPST